MHMAYIYRHSFPARNNALFVKDALAWASMVYGLNPHPKCEADHRASCQKRVRGMVVCPWVSYVLFLNLRSAFECVWWVLGPVLYQFGQAWASLESGVQRAFTSYCMTRFQRTSKSRRLYTIKDVFAEVLGTSTMMNHDIDQFVPDRYVSNIVMWLMSDYGPFWDDLCMELRGGREGMSKIKSIIHAKLKARSLTPDMLKKLDLDSRYSSILIFVFHVFCPFGFWSLVGVQLTDSGWKEKTIQRPKGKAGEGGICTHACMRMHMHEAY